MSLLKNKEKSAKNQKLAIYSLTVYSRFYIKEIVCVCFPPFSSRYTFAQHLPFLYPVALKLTFMSIFSFSIQLRWLN